LASCPNPIPPMISSDEPHFEDLSDIDSSRWPCHKLFESSRSSVDKSASYQRQLSGPYFRFAEALIRD